LVFLTAFLATFFAGGASALAGGASAAIRIDRGVIGRDLQPFGGGRSLQHRIFRDLLVPCLGFTILGFGSKANVVVTPLFSGRYQAFILLLRNLPDHDIQIGFRHCSFPQVQARKLHMTEHAIAGVPLQLTPRILVS
jgi:hypothetical protein